jgi:hypothetical protein
MQNRRQLRWIALLHLSFLPGLSGCSRPEEGVSSPERTTIDFQELIRIADRHDLPAPPGEASLVLANTGWTQLVGSSSTSHDPGIYRPAFLLETLPGDRARVLMGWEERIVDSDADFRPAIRPFSPVPPEKKLKGHVLDRDPLSTIATVVQLSRRGDVENARLLWERIDSEWRLVLAEAIYQHFHEATLQDGADLKSIHAKLVRLQADFPILFSNDETHYHAYDRSRFIRDLGLTLSTETPPEGSVEALLIEWGKRPSHHRHLGYFDEHTEECDRPARDIFRLGLEALPHLARLTRDTRLTRHVAPYSEGERLRLGDLASALLADMTGSLGPGGAAAIEDRPESEIEFFAKAAVKYKEDRISGFHGVPLWILGEKNPTSLLDLCSYVPSKATSDAPLFKLTWAILRSRLALADKSAALGNLAERLEGDPRLRAALQPLAQVDGPRCAALLLPVLARLPGDVAEPYWTSEAASWTHVVMQLEDDRVWQAYLKAACNAAVGLRMQMMNPMCYAYIEGKNRERRLGFLAAFLDDTDVRDPSVDSYKYEGPCAAFTFETIEVRDFAAMDIAGILGLGEDPTEFWTPADWARLRTRVREALREEKLPAWTG